MNILLDTHIAIWAITDDPRLSEKARELILDESNNVCLSAISTLEVNSKRNNLEFTTSQFVEACEEAGYFHFPLHSKHFLTENSLKWGGDGDEHKDPYDRLLLAQAKSERMYLMTHDKMIQSFDEKWIIGV